MTDKIQEELEKGCGKMALNSRTERNDAVYCGGKSNLCHKVLCKECQAKLSQHIATKQAMIKEFDETFDNFNWEQYYLPKRIKLKLKEELKSKLKEIK